MWHRDCTPDVGFKTQKKISHHYWGRGEGQEFLVKAMNPTKKECIEITSKGC